MCAGICASSSITMTVNKHGFSTPELDPSTCVDCGKCIEICVGKRIPPLSSKKILGNYKRICLTYSTDNTLRKRASSGGVVSSLLAFGLEKGVFRDVLTLDSSTSPLRPVPIKITNAEEIKSLSGSKYISYPICAEYKEISPDTAVTMLPCHSSALRAESRSKGFIFGLFCSKTISTYILEYMLENMDVKLSDIKEIDFRNGPWPGKVMVRFDMKTIKFNYNRSLWASAYNSYLFSQAGCLLCNDYFNDKADIAFGDPWGIKSIYGGNGSTLVIIRSERGLALFNSAIKNNVITAEDVSEREIIYGHLAPIYIKRSGIKHRIAALKQKGFLTPWYSEEDIIPSNSIGRSFEKFYLDYGVYSKFRKDYLKIKRPRPFVLFIKRFLHAALLRLYLRFSNYAERLLSTYEK